MVSQLDLQGFDAELAVISGRASELRRMERLVGEQGLDPARWLPEFMASRGAE